MSLIIVYISLPPHQLPWQWRGSLDGCQEPDLRKKRGKRAAMREADRAEREVRWMTSMAVHGHGKII